MKKRMWVGAKGFLTAYALTAVFHEPFYPSYFETIFDYIIASVYELLGQYQLEFVLIWILSSVLYTWVEERAAKSDAEKMGRQTEKYASKLLAAFFSGCLLLGRSYHELDSWNYIFGSPVNFVKSAMAFAGFGQLIYTLMGCVGQFLHATEFQGKENKLFGRRAFLKSFLILSAVYGLVVFIAYPGTLCWDTVGQIEQVVKGSGYSAHHPLMHTFMVGGLVKLGYMIFGAYEPGLFLYMLLQVVMLAAALASTIAVLSKRNVKDKWLAGLLLLYCITPIYTNIVSIAIKDVPYCAFVIGYGVCFALLLEKPALIQDRRFVVCFVLMQLGAILFRNNGLPMVLLSGLGALLYLFKKYDRKKRLQYCLAAFGVSIAVGKLVSLLLIQTVGAAQGSSGEMFSIPFQQTARYLQLYQAEISPEERAAIEAVLGPVENVAAAYDPAISDPVKALFDKASSTGEVVNYFAAWLKGLWKHPIVYVEAFLNHVYGWFSPGVSNAIRYEIEYDLISQQGLFPQAQKILLFVYRFADRISVLGILQNVGAFVWGLFFLVYYQYKEKKQELMWASLPLWVSLLVCMASPCFIYHPRYALPIICLIPYLYGVTVSGKGES